MVVEVGSGLSEPLDFGFMLSGELPFPNARLGFAQCPVAYMSGGLLAVRGCDVPKRRLQSSPIPFMLFANISNTNVQRR